MQFVITKDGLISPASYVYCTPEQLASVINGCGPGNFWAKLVPDSVADVEYFECCNIHDWMYGVRGGWDRAMADGILLANCTVMARRHTKGLLHDVERMVALRSAWTYYTFVTVGGHKCFTQDVEEPKHEGVKELFTV